MVGCLRLALAAAVTVPMSLGGTAASAHWVEQPASGEGVPSSDEAAKIELAREKVKQGQALYEQARYEEALASFQDAAAAYASPDFQFNIGLCYERLGELRPAINAFETYVRNKPDATDRASVEHRISQLREQLEEANKPTRSPATFTPPPPVEQPEKAVAAEKDLQVGAEQERRAKRLVTTGAVMLGVGAAISIGGGLGFGLPANDKATRVDAVLNRGNPDALTRAQTTSLAEDADLLRVGQITSIGVGAAVAITGAALLGVGLRRKRSTNVALILNRGTLGLSASTRF